jgi:flavin reductase (DIM6/NTAB) family NADH-FMN oxidoreductase RutF
MIGRYEKIDLPVSKVRRYLEPGPIVLVTSACGKIHDIMTMGWHTVMEFTPSLVGCVIAAGNHSFELVRRSGECVINLPTRKLTNQVVAIGNTSGAEIDKFATFALTPQKAQRVGAPLIRECHANFECKLADDTLVDKYNFFIFEVVKAHVARRRDTRRPCTMPATAFSWSPGRLSAGAANLGRNCWRIDRSGSIRSFITARQTYPRRSPAAGEGCGSSPRRHHLRPGPS